MMNCDPANLSRGLRGVVENTYTVHDTLSRLLTATNTLNNNNNTTQQGNNNVVEYFIIILIAMSIICTVVHLFLGSVYDGGQKHTQLMTKKGSIIRFIFVVIGIVAGFCLCKHVLVIIAIAGNMISLIEVLRSYYYCGNSPPPSPPPPPTTTTTRQSKAQTTVVIQEQHASNCF